MRGGQQLKEKLNKIMDVLYGQPLKTKIAVGLLMLWAIILSVIAGKVGIFLFMLFVTMVVFIVNHNKREYIYYFAIAFIATSVIMCSVFYLQTYIRGNSVLYGDSRYYLGCITEYGADYSLGQLYNHSIINSAYTFFGLTIPQSGFVYLVGLLGKIFGADVSTSVIFYNLCVSLFGALVLLYTVKLCDVTTKDIKITKYAFWISLLYPHFLLTAGVLLKDMLVILLVVFIAYHTITFREKKALKIVAIILAMVVFMFTRYRFALIMFELVLVSMIIPRKEKLTLKNVFSFNMKKIIIIIIIIISCVMIYKFAYAGSTEFYYAKNDVQRETITGEDYFKKDEALVVLEDTEQQDTEQQDTEQQDTEQQDTDNVSAAPGKSFGFNKIGYMLPIGLRELYRFVYVFFFPFYCWSSLSCLDIELIKYVFMDIGSLYWLACLPFLLAGTLETCKKKKYDNVNILYVIGIIFVLAVFNYIRVRWRMMAMPFMAVLIAIGIYKRKEYKKLLVVSGTILTSLLVLYIIYSIIW